MKAAFVVIGVIVLASVLFLLLCACCAAGMNDELIDGISNRQQDDEE